MVRIGQLGSARWSATPIVSSMRIELDETALVRPSNAELDRGAGSAESTTIVESPLESSAEASARPITPQQKMIPPARSMGCPLSPWLGHGEALARRSNLATDS